MFGCRVGMTTELGWLQLQRTGRRPATTLCFVRCFFSYPKRRNPGPFQNTGSQWIAWRLKRVPFMKMRIGLFPHLVFSVLGIPQEKSYPKIPQPHGWPQNLLKINGIHGAFIAGKRSLLWQGSRGWVGCGGRLATEGVTPDWSQYGGNEG